MKINGKLITVNVDQVEPNDYNFNVMTPALLAKERESLTRFGMVKPPLVWEPITGHYIIIDGEHRYSVLKDAGETEITVRNLGKIELKEAKQLTILLNEIRGEPDYTKLTSLFGSLDSLTVEDISKILPYSAEEVTAMVDSAGFDWGEYDFSREPEEPKKPSAEYVEIVCRIPDEDVGPIKEKTDALCEKHGFYDKSAPVQLGKLFDHMLINTQEAPAE